MCAAATLMILGGWLLSLSRLAAAQVPRVDATPINSVAEDSTGVIWATGPTQGAPAKLYRWEGDQWVAAPGPTSIPGAWAEGVWRGPQGGVVVAWNSPAENATAFTWQRGSTVKILGSIEAVRTPTGSQSYSTTFLGSPQVVATSSGDILITGDSPTIYRAEPGGEIRSVYTIPPRQYLPHSQLLNQQPSYLPLRATQDSQRRTWIWSGLPARVVAAAALRGFLLDDGKGFDYHVGIPGLPSSQLSCLGHWDKNHLAAGIINDGLYTIDTSVLTAQRVAAPEPGAFRFIQKVFYVGEDRYVITSTFGLPQAQNPEAGPFGILWRFRDGRWKKLLTGLDEINDYRYQLDRPWVETPQGVWLGGWAKGLWFIPTAGGEQASGAYGRSPRQINWKQGFPLDTVNGLFSRQDGSFLAVDFSPARTVATSPASLLTAAKSVNKVQVINPFTMLQPDQRLHIWSILTVGGRALDEWDGAKWTAHPLPGDIDPAWLSGLDVDSEGRIWLFPDCRMGPMAVFDPRDGKWADYPSYQAALAAPLAHPVRFLHPDDDRMKPIYGPSSQIVYNGACQGINYFDGTDWRVWNRPDMPGNPDFFFDGPPFFDAAGHLAVNIHHETREWRRDLGWQLIPYEPHAGEIVHWFHAQSSQTPPPGCPSTASTSLARDPLGRSWWTWDGNLYEGISGLCRKALSATEPQPFIDGRLLRRVLTDDRGNVFLETLLAGGGIGEYAILSSSGPLPRTAIHLTQLSPDSMSADFQSTASGGALFTWRLDGGEWSAPEKQSRVLLPTLPGGEHRLEAASIDSRLQMDSVPASAGFNIAVKPQEQVSALISRLASAQSDDEREAAIEALAKQTASVVLPALTAARARAGSDERWWIDAAIQEVKGRMRQAKDNGHER